MQNLKKQVEIRCGKMKFPEKHIKHKETKLHSGETSNIFYDVNKLLTDYEETLNIFKSISARFDTYVGIATGGAIIAHHYHPFAMIKDGELKGTVKGNYCLIDDVVTTESSIKEAIKIIGDIPNEIIVCVDRRKEKHMDITSIYNIGHVT